jgi:hypothetical protein
MTPSNTVRIRPRLSWLRLSFIRPQCAQVRVAPEVSSSAVLIAGMPQAPIGVKLAPLGPEVGQPPAKSGHSVNAGSMPASAGTEMVRHVEQGAEEGGEEHDLGADEPDHARGGRIVFPVGVGAALVFADHRRTS